MQLQKKSFEFYANANRSKTDKATSVMIPQSFTSKPRPGAYLFWKAAEGILTSSTLYTLVLRCQSNANLYNL